jgi:hypothetical protein
LISRRLYQHIQSHNWFAVAVDFLIVVIGVFVGIQVSNWNAGRMERRAARTYVERIREDIDASANSIGNMLTYYQTVKQHALAALAAFDRPEAELDQQFLVDAYQASQILMRSVERSTYDEILSAGAMNSIPDVEVRRRLANFYKNVDAIEELMRYVPPYRETLRRYLPYAVQSAIFERCDDVASVNARGFVSSTLPERCDLGLPAEAIASGIAAIRTAELKLDLARRLADLDTKLKNYQRLVDRGASLDRFLAEAEI